MVSELRVRPYVLEDAPALVALLNQGRETPRSVEAFLAREAARPPGEVQARLVGYEGERLVAYGMLRQDFLVPARWLAANLRVDRTARRRGYGRAMAEALDRRADELNAAGLQVLVADNDLLSRTWAERRGFAPFSHAFESVLPLGQVDVGVVDARLERVKERGVNIVAVEDVHGEEEELYALFTDLLVDAPDMVGCPVPSIEFFRHEVTRSPVLDRLYVAESPGQRMGIHVVMRYVPQELYTYFTGVRAEYRGRGIAHALKARGIERARELGVPRMRTDNLSINAPMLRVNRSLGYEPRPGVLRMRRSA